MTRDVLAMTCSEIKLTESKEVFPIFKSFKSLAAELKFASNVYIDGSGEGIQMLFPRESEFYLMSGRILNEVVDGNLFFQWIQANGRTVAAAISDLSLLGKVLKKNAISVTYTNESFLFNFLDKESGEEKTISFTQIKDNTVKNLNDSLFAFSQNFVKKKEVPLASFSKEITVLYEDGDSELAEEHEKLIEIPTERINSLVKDLTKASISFSSRSDDNNSTRRVAITSQNSELQLTQYFVTV